MKRKLSTISVLLLTLLFTFLISCKSNPSNNTNSDSANNTTELEASSESDMAIASQSGKILVISDIHFNPFYDPSILKQLIAADYTDWEGIFDKSKVKSYGEYRNDTYFPLFKSAMNEMPTIESSPDFIIITGDFIAHNFEAQYQNLTQDYDLKHAQDFITKTESFIVSQLAKKYPSTPMLPVLGNNDGYCGDYHITANGDFLKFFANLWLPRLQNAYGTQNFVTTFSKGGYYAVAMPWDSTQVFIGLNTNFFSPGHYNNNHINYCSNTIPTKDAANEQLAWLKSTLAKCKTENKKVWMAYHIPPGMDIYSSRTCPKVKPMWDKSFNDDFLSLIKQYSGTIAANFAGHTHMDDFRVIEDSGTPVSFIHITPSISPVNGNNPAIQLVDWNATDMTLNNSITHYFKGIETTGDDQWVPEYNFNKAYNQNGINANTLSNVAQNVYTDKDSTREKYLQFYEVDKNHTVPSDWRAYWCGLTKLTIKDYSECYCKKK
jgi:predicted phosphodiesterase